MNQVLYRKWRPKTFSEVAGQEHITDVLRYEVANGKTAHAYLFCGSRGTGKTTCAKILAKAVNCENPQNGEPCGKCPSCIGIDEGTVTDVLEMDAASNTGVDYIRDIRDTVIYAPSSVKYRVYIIDEVHMLSSSAFNAFLKTLEEPPTQVIFILATTEIQKLPATIISRCRRFDFRRIALPNLTARLSYIAEQENIVLEPDGALTIARLAQGGMRDAISMLELCATGGFKVDAARVRETAGVAGREISARITNAIIEERLDIIFREIGELYSSSKDISAFWQELVSFYRDMLIIKTLDKEAAGYLDLTEEEFTETRGCAVRLTKETIIRQCAILDEAFTQMQRNIVSKRLTAEFALIKAAYRYDDSPEALAARISVLEEKLSGASVVKNSPKATEPPEKEPIKAVTPPIEQTQKPPQTEKKVYRAVPWWIEVVNKFDPMIIPMIRDAQAYKSESEQILWVAVKSPIALEMVDKSDIKDKLLNLCAQYADITEIKVKIAEKKTETASTLDEIETN